METVYLSLLCVGAALICAMLRPQRPEMALGVALAAGAAALMLLLPGLQSAAQVIREFSIRAQQGQDGAAVLLRAAGIALLAEFAQQICEDAGEKALAGRIELGVRVALFGIAAPLLREVLVVVEEVLL
ncbi:MAG TPA: hypothetical protein IAB02_09580 [Candidatus Pullichristensenella excrementigallinarum]|uniref:Stage III sporulation protein AD n=1 Tax=Candidatus Pullichristensenella excrementigallinarum TaxID=2840907 RepID=A0A9D1ICM2_9FIRM|nr:hypothetical protein [Candidatus Pullichristensenella excrementigallinarum]